MMTFSPRVSENKPPDDRLGTNALILRNVLANRAAKLGGNGNSDRQNEESRLIAGFPVQVRFGDF